MKKNLKWVLLFLLLVINQFCVMAADNETCYTKSESDNRYYTKDEMNSILMDISQYYYNKTEIDAIAASVDQFYFSKEKLQNSNENNDGASLIGYYSSWVSSTVKNALDELYNLLIQNKNQLNDLENRAVKNVKGIDLYLHKGWNTFKLPWFILKGTAFTQKLDLNGNYSVTNVLKSINGKYSYLAYYDGNEWQTFVPSDENASTFFSFPVNATSRDYEFYIYMSEGARLNIETYQEPF